MSENTSPPASDSRPVWCDDLQATVPATLSSPASPDGPKTDLDAPAGEMRKRYCAQCAAATVVYFGEDDRERCDNCRIPFDEPPAVTPPSTEHLLLPGEHVGLGLSKPIRMRKASATLEVLRAELGRTRITSENIGAIRAKYLIEGDHDWNSVVLDETAAREIKEPPVEAFLGILKAEHLPLAESEAMAATFSSVEPKPAHAAPLKAILAAAERFGGHMCFHVTDLGFICGSNQASTVHGNQRGDHPFVSLATLLSSVAELAKGESEEAILLRYLNAPEPRIVHVEDRDHWKGRATEAEAEVAKCHPALEAVEAERDRLLVTTAELAKMVRELKEVPPAESYRPLETGEIIQEGDEWQDSAGKWYPAKCEEKVVLGRYRRPVTGGAGLHEAATCDQRDREKKEFADALWEAMKPWIRNPYMRVVISALATVFSV